MNNKKTFFYNIFLVLAVSVFLSNGPIQNIVNAMETEEKIDATDNAYKKLAIIAALCCTTILIPTAIYYYKTTSKQKIEFQRKQDELQRQQTELQKQQAEFQEQQAKLQKQETKLLQQQAKLQEQIPGSPSIITPIIITPISGSPPGAGDEIIPQQQPPSDTTNTKNQLSLARCITAGQLTTTLDTLYPKRLYTEKERTTAMCATFHLAKSDPKTYAKSWFNTRDNTFDKTCAK
jgi:erythromycin esterase-like protein